MIILFKRFLTPTGRISMFFSPPSVAVAIIVAAIFLSSGNELHAEESTLETRLASCSEIDGRNDRLRCYDALVDVPSPDTITPLTEPQSVQKADAATSSSPSLEDRPRFGQKYLESEREQQRSEKTTYTLTGAYKNKSELWVFEFDNGEVWRQLEARYLSVPRDLPATAELSRGIFGSYNFRIGGNGRTIKVKRLK